MLAILVAVGVLVQVASIAYAWFDVVDLTDGGTPFAGIEDDGNAGHTTHSIGGSVIALLALVLLIVSFFARIPGGVKWAAIVVGLVALQFVLAILGFEVPIIGALHGLNALAVAAVAGRAARQASEVDTPASPTPRVA